MSLGKINTKFVGMSKGILSFAVERESMANAKYCVKQMEELIEKDSDIFVVQVDKYQSTRSLEQNKLLWALLGIMSKSLGNVTDVECYCDMLELAGQKYEYLQCTRSAYEFFKTQFRATKVVEHRKAKTGETFIVKCFYGSSKMNVKEMWELTNLTFSRLMEMGIPDEYQADLDYRYTEWTRK